jgi:hypothetical protein
MSDDCMIIFGHGKPQHPPEQENQRAIHTATISELTTEMTRSNEQGQL